MSDPTSIDNMNDDDCEDIIIELTKERLEQELSNISADETKASIIIGFVVAIFGITFVVNDYLTLLLNNSLSWLPIVFLFISLGVSIYAAYPRSRLQLIDPLSTNNAYSKLKSGDLKKAIKKELIENFAYIEKNRKYDPWCIRFGFSFMIAGTIGIFIILIILNVSK